MSEYTIISIVGARPQFIKLAPVARAMDAQPNIRHLIVHTGQHYDENMSDAFFTELDIPRPDLNLGVGSGSQSMQTAKMMEMLEAQFMESKPDVVVVYGDTNSTLAATLAASKLDIPLAHVEAGLRSFNRTMPEEINRLVADHCSDRLYAPTPTAVKNLTNENLSDRSMISGDVMYDAVQQNLVLAGEKSNILKEHGLEPGTYSVLTLHRASNTTPESVKAILQAVERCSAEHSLPVVFPVHPRTRSIIETAGSESSNMIQYVEPVPYLDMLTLVGSARLVLTDSGGLQKEAAFLSTPCITLREETEWVETVELGVNVLVGTDEKKLNQAFKDTLAAPDMFGESTITKLQDHFGSGDASRIIVDDLMSTFARKKIA